MTEIQKTQQEIIDEFADLGDWMDKYEYLIELGKSLEPVEEHTKLEDFLIKGCQSRVWLFPSYKDGLLYFKADSDAIITKGIVSLLIRVFSGRRPDEILNADFGFIETIGLKDHLSPTRANGLLAMIEQIRQYAIAAQNA